MKNVLLEQIFQAISNRNNNVSKSLVFETGSKQSYKQLPSKHCCRWQPYWSFLIAITSQSTLLKLFLSYWNCSVLGKRKSSISGLNQIIRSACQRDRVVLQELLIDSRNKGGNLGRSGCVYQIRQNNCRSKTKHHCRTHLVCLFFLYIHKPLCTTLLNIF